MTRISIRLSFVGAHVDCRTNASSPRTFSSSSTMTSPSENRPTTTRPRLMFRCRQTASASFGFALPVKIRMRSKAIGRCDSRIRAVGSAAAATRPQRTRGSTHVRRAGWHHDSLLESMGEMAGEEGFEPSNAGIKIRCLNQLGDSPAETCAQSPFRAPPRTNPMVTRTVQAEASPSRRPAGGCA